MTIAIPVSAHDRNLYQDFMRVLLDVLPAAGHRLVVFPSLSQHDIPPLASVEMVPLAFEPEGGWPMACNQHFHAVATWMREHSKDFFYFMELDSCPIRKNWADFLQLEYLGNLEVHPDRVYMGCVVPTRFLDEGGQPRIDPTRPHMVGSGIYPPDTIDRLYPSFRASRHPWDILCMGEIMRHCHPTKQIAHRWGTVNYQFNEYGPFYTCENRPENPPGSDHSEKVFGDACVVHGCKDGSLAKLVLEGKHF